MDKSLLGYTFSIGDRQYRVIGHHYARPDLLAVRDITELWEQEMLFLPQDYTKQRLCQVRDDVKRYSNENGYLCDDFEAAGVADEIVYLSIMDGTNSYEENLRKGIQCRRRRKGRNSHYEITVRLQWMKEEQTGILYRLLLKIPETAKEAEEKLKEAKGAWKEGQFTESQLIRALCKKNLVTAELRDALLPYLIQPLAEKDLYGYLLRQKREDDTAFVPRAIHFYLWEQNLWDKRRQ